MSQQLEPETPSALVVRVLRSGAQLWVEDGELRFRAPKGALTPELREEVARHRPAIISLLGDRVKHASPSFAQERVWLLNRSDRAGYRWCTPIVVRTTGPRRLCAGAQPAPARAAPRGSAEEVPIDRRTAGPGHRRGRLTRGAPAGGRPGRIGGVRAPGGGHEARGGRGTPPLPPWSASRPGERGWCGWVRTSTSFSWRSTASPSTAGRSACCFGGARRRGRAGRPRSGAPAARPPARHEVAGDTCSRLIRAPSATPRDSWKELGAEQARDLAEVGPEQVKRRQALRYFTWRWRFSALRGSEQFRFLLSQSSPATLAACASAPADLSDRVWRGVPWPRRERWLYTFAVRLLWEYARRNDPLGVTELEEPSLGDPLPVRWRGRTISQDLANSALELAAIDRALEGGEPASILEIGAGYGRLGHALLSLSDRRPTPSSTSSPPGPSRSGTSRGCSRTVTSDSSLPSRPPTWPRARSRWGCRCPRSRR